MDYQPTIIDTVHIFLTNIQLYKHRVLPFNIFFFFFQAPCNTPITKSRTTD